MRLDTSQQMRTDMRLRMAPRMIQSMEILQLPLMALQERIDQELSENPVLVDLGAVHGAARPTPSEPPDAGRARRRRARARRHRTTGPSRSASRTASAGRALSEEADRKHDAMQNMASRPQSLHDDLADQLGFLDADPAVRALAEYIIHNLDDNGFLNLDLARGRARLRRRRHPRAGRGGPAPGPEARPARRRRPQPPRVPAAPADPRDPLPRRPPGPDRQPPRRHPAEPPADDREEDGHPDRADQGGDRAPAPARPPPGRPVRPRERPVRRARPDRRAQRAGRVRGPPDRRPHAAPGDLALLPEAAQEQGDRPRRPRVHPEADPVGPLADRVDRAAAQHAAEGGPRDHRAPEGVPRQGPRVRSSR